MKQMKSQKDWTRYIISLAYVYKGFSKKLPLKKDNAIGDEGATALGNMLKTNSTLTRIHLGSKPFFVPI